MMEMSTGVSSHTKISNHTKTPGGNSRPKCHEGRHGILRRLGKILHALSEISAGPTVPRYRYSCSTRRDTGSMRQLRHPAVNPDSLCQVGGRNVVNRRKKCRDWLAASSARYGNRASCPPTCHLLRILQMLRKSDVTGPR